MEITKFGQLLADFYNCENGERTDKWNEENLQTVIDGAESRGEFDLLVKAVIKISEKNPNFYLIMQKKLGASGRLRS